MEASEPIKYAVLGLHGAVARVRFFITPDAENKEDRFVDEDVTLPEILPGVPPTLEVYETILKPELLKRFDELEGGAK